MNRRQFSFALGSTALGLASRAGASALDALASAVSETALKGAPLNPSELAPARIVEHWRVVENDAWRWLERSELVGGLWRPAGMTLPVSRETGVPVAGRDCADHLLECEAPAGLIEAIEQGASDYCFVREGAEPGPSIIDERKLREGRPPSRWARDLQTPELRAWLGSFEPPKADVGGMTFLEHLTRDHGFEERFVIGLTEPEQAKLHGAAHAGY